MKPKGTGNLIDSSPIKIPGNAVKVEQAKNGYEQIKYIGLMELISMKHVGIQELLVHLKIKGILGLLQEQLQEAKQQESNNIF